MPLCSRCTGRGAPVRGAYHGRRCGAAESGAQFCVGVRYHFPAANNGGGPFVEYLLPEGESLSPECRAEIGQRLQTDVDMCIAANERVRVVHLPLGRARPRFSTDYGLPATLKDDTEVQVVTIAGNVCPCSGTHVFSTAQLAGLKIDKIVVRGKRIKVQYTVPTPPPPSADSPVCAPVVPE